MEYRIRSLLTAVWVLSVIVCSRLAYAGAAHDRAAAAVVVARTIVQIAAESPALPDTPRRTRTQNPREVQDALEGKEAPRVVPMQFFPTSDVATQLENSAELPNRLKATIFTAEDHFGRHWCPNCVRLQRHWGQGNDQIELAWSTAKANGPQIYPAIRFVDQTGQERFPAGTDGDYRILSQLDDLIELVKRHQQPASSTRVEASGFGGSIRASGQIRQALVWFRESVGENVKVEFQWHRTGGQTFPLLAKGDWSAPALFGKYGHVNFSTTGTTRFPVSSAGFSYQIKGDDVTFDLDALTISGLALQLGPSSSHPWPLKLSEAAPAPSQVGPMTVWTVVSVVRDLWSLLHPSCDLQLSGSITATAELTRDVLTIEFDQMPSIRIVALFTFQLGVKQVVITESNIHIEFSGSRFIKSRDFAVE